MPGKIPERMNAFTVVINILSKKFKIFFLQNNKWNTRKQRSISMFFTLTLPGLFTVYKYLIIPSYPEIIYFLLIN